MKETNMEHFRVEIEAAGHDFALTNGKVVKCSRCTKCDFETEPDEERESCAIKRVRWLMSEYEPEPILTAREKGFVECVVDGWIARDKNGDLKWSEILFDRDNLNGMWYLSKVSAEAYLRIDCFPFITWEDEEPWAVEDLRKLKVEGGEVDD